MNTVKDIQEGLASVANEQKKESRRWFFGLFKAKNWRCKADDWDRQIEEDIIAGKLEPLVKKALEDHKAGKTTEL